MFKNPLGTFKSQKLMLTRPQNKKKKLYDDWKTKVCVTYWLIPKSSEMKIL